MPLLRNDTLVSDDPWVFFDDAADLPSDLKLAIVTLERWQTLTVQNTKVEMAALPAGVQLAPNDKTSDLAPYIKDLRLICIEFPTYTDGRGYTHARLLRTRYGYTGELRAVGDIRPDQMLFMRRMGFDAFEGDQVLDANALEPYMTRFEHNYQPSYALPKDRSSGN